MKFNKTNLEKINLVNELSIEAQMLKNFQIEELEERLEFTAPPTYSVSGSVSSDGTATVTGSVSW